MHAVHIAFGVKTSIMVVMNILRSCCVVKALSVVHQKLSAASIIQAVSFFNIPCRRIIIIIFMILKVTFIHKILSSNRWNKLFFWTWILKFYHFKGLKSCHMRLHFAIWTIKTPSNPYVTWFEPFQVTQIQNVKFRKIIWFIYLEIWQTL